MTNTCGNCQFWQSEQSSIDDAAMVRQCRFMPQEVLKHYFDWCGQHQPKAPTSADAMLAIPDSKTQTEIRGELFGVRILPPVTTNSATSCIQVLTEDDGNWIEFDGPFSSYWLDDLITQLQAAKAVLDNTDAP